MKTSNLAQGPAHREALIRGWVSTFRAGGTGISGIDVVGGTVIDNGDGTVTIIIDGSGVGPGGAVPGDVTPDDTTAATVADAAAHEAFPGIAWLDTPGASTHTTGDRFLIVYRSASSHLTNGKAVGKIGTITATVPWTYTLGSQFDIEDIANDVRVDDSVSVLDIGGTYRAVVLAREFSGGANHTPHVLICDDPAASMTSGSTWTRHDIALSGHTQDLGAGRVLKLQDGTYLCAAYHLTGATSTTCVVQTSDITDWSSPTITDIATGYTEIDVEQVADGTLHANMRNSADTHIFASSSTDNGATWSTPVSQFAGTHFPTWRVLNSGIGLITYGDTSGFDVAFRITASGSLNTGYGTETILQPDPTLTGNYASLLQLDDNHVLLVYAFEVTGIPDPVFSDIYSIVLVDSSVIGDSTGDTALDDLTDVTITSPQFADRLRYDGLEWVNSNLVWEPMIASDGSVMTDGLLNPMMQEVPY